MKLILSLFILFFLVVTSYSQKDNNTNQKVIVEGSTDPGVLVVINGKIAGNYSEVKNALYKINPQDIESLDVLKGIKATEKYGEKAKAGVIEITMKAVKIQDVWNPESVRINLADSAIAEVDVKPSFPGGEAGWRRFLEQNLNANTPVDNGAPAGTYKVMVQFVVDKDGSVSKIQALTNHGYGLEKEVIRLLSLVPKWIPASVSGQNVKAYRLQPVTFVVITDFELSTTTIEANTPTVIEIREMEHMKDDEIEVSLSYGTIKHISGKKYEITVDKPGDIKFSIHAKGKKKKDRYEIGTETISVK